MLLTEITRILKTTTTENDRYTGRNIKINIYILGEL